VSADAAGAGAVIPDRALGNDAYVQQIGAWDTIDNGCGCWGGTPFVGFSGGVVAPQIDAYDVTDFTLLICSEMVGGHPYSHSHYGVAERFPTGCDGASSTGGPWWSFGLRNSGIGGLDPTVRVRAS